MLEEPLVVLSVRVPASTARRIDALVVPLARVRPGERVARAVVARAVVEMGLEDLERDLKGKKR